MNICPACGQQVQEESLFCCYCDYEFEENGVDSEESFILHAK